MGQELVVPQAFTGKGMSQAFQTALGGQTDSLADGIGQSYPVISYKGKVWGIRYRGERKTVIRPDDGTPSAYLDVIILGQAPQKSKSYYKAFDANTSDGDRPICSSIDGVVPDADVTTKQCDSCALCPRNVWKTQANGKKGRECTDYKRLAVLILPTQSQPTLGQPLLEPTFLRVPPDSLNSLAIMGETMGAQGHHYSSYITRITFDPQKAHPCMVFRPLQPLTDGEAGVILDLRSDAQVGRITGAELASAGLGAVATALAPPAANGHAVTAAVTTAQSPPPSPAPPAPPPPPPAPPAPPASISSGLVSTAAPASGPGLAPAFSLPLVDAPPVTPTPNTSAEPTGISTGLGGGASTGANTASGSPQPSGLTQTVGDAGKAEESDEELDAEIAALIQPK